MAAVAFKVTPLVFVRKFGDFSDLRSYPFSEILIKKKNQTSFMLYENAVLTCFSVISQNLEVVSKAYTFFGSVSLKIPSRHLFKPRK